MDTLQPTPRVNPFIGGLADLLTASYSPQRTQQMQGLMKFMGVPDVAQTLDRISYGEPITSGRGMTTALRPEAQGALLALLGVAPMGKGAEPAAMAAGRAGERLAERVVPQVMERGGLPAEMLGAMGQGSRSKIFIGPEAKTWDKDAAFEAAKMEKAKVPAEEIWRATMTGRNADKLWRQELSDLGSTIKGSKPYGDLVMEKYKAGVARTGDQAYQPTVDDVLFHHPLKEAYPDLFNVPAQLLPATATARGNLLRDGENLRMRLRPDLASEDARSTILHELQHGIQGQERFGAGGSVRLFAEMQQQANDQIDALNMQLRYAAKKLDDKSLPAAEKAQWRKQYDEAMREKLALVPNAQIDPMEAYGHLMGEAEARLVQRRMNLTPEQRRQNYPFQFTGQTGYGFDVDPAKMILMNPEGQILESGLLGNIR